MHPATKKALQILKYFFISMCVLVLLVVFTVQKPFMHSIITQQANNYFRKHDLPLHIGSFSFSLKGELELKQIEIVSHKDDTILYAGNILIDFRLLPLISKELIVNSVSVDDVNVRIIYDSTGVMNLLALFPHNESDEDGSTSGSTPWEMQIGELHFNYIRFLYSDISNGIIFNQTLDHADISLNMFSLLHKQVDIESLVINSANGSMEMWRSANGPEEQVAEVSPWNFSANSIELKDVSFEYNNSSTGQIADIKLNKSFLGIKSIDLTQKQMLISQLDLDSPEIFFRDSDPMEVENPANPVNPVNDVDSSKGWTMVCNLLEVSNGIFSYQPGREVADTSITQWMPVKEFNTKIENIVYSSVNLGLNLKQLAFSLNNKAILQSATIYLKSDSLNNGDLKMELLASIDYMNRHQFQLVDTLRITMNVSGALEKWMIDEFTVNTSSGIEIAIQGAVHVAENISNLDYNLLIRTNAISRNQVAGWLSIVNPDLHLPDFSPLSISGTLSNTIQKPNFNLIASSNSGRARLTGNYNLSSNYAQLNATVSRLRLNDLFGAEYPSNIYGSFSWDGVLGSLGNLDGTGNLKIDSLKYKNTVSRDISLLFEATKNTYLFTLLANDSALSCAINGEVFGDNVKYHGRINGELSVNNQHHDILPSLISLKSTLNSTFNIDGENVESSLTLSDIKIGNPKEDFAIDSFACMLNLSDASVNSQLRSEFVVADFSFKDSYRKLLETISSVEFDRLVNWNSSSFLSEIRFEHIPEFNFEAKAEYDSVLMLFVDDSVFAFEEIEVAMSKNPENQMVDIEIEVGSMNYLDTKGFGAQLNLEAKGSSLSGDLFIDSLHVNRVSTGRAQLKLDVLPEKIIGFISVNDTSGLPFYQFGAEASKNHNRIYFVSQMQEWILNSEKWSLRNPEIMDWNLSNNNVNAGLFLFNDEHKIELNGSMSDTLVLKIENVPIHKIISPSLIPDLPDGVLDVKVEYSNKLRRHLDFQLNVSGFAYHELVINKMESVGDFEIDAGGNVIGKMLTLIDGTSKVNLVVSAGAVKGESIIDATFFEIPSRFSQPFIHEYVDNMSGTLGGKLKVKTSENASDINGEITLRSVGMNIVPLNSRFVIPDDTVRLQENHIYFRDFAIYDSLGKELFLNGKLELSDKGDLISDLKITMDNLLVMNTTVKDNPDFFGKVIVRSDLTLKGPITVPAIKGNVSLAGGTNITYRQVDDITVQETQKTINFVSLYEDTSLTLSLLSGVRQMSESPSVQTTIEIDPSSKFNFIIYNGYEINISIGGSGLLNYGLLPNNTMSLTGGYEISSGAAKLKFSGWPIKDFLITPGSSMRWDGNVSDPIVNLEATSTVKGSYVNPVDNKTRTVDFIVSMKLTEQVSQLKIGFDVKSPDQYISSVLNSLSEDELMRQAINLLIFESINLPNIESNSNYLTSQINSFWESQLNSLSKTTIKGVDLSFGIDSYTQESASGGSEEKTSLTYEVQKKILNDRASVKVSGRLNDDTEAGSANNSVLENFIFEYELDTLDRKFLKIYTRRDYEDILDGEVTKSGVGFIYRKTYPDFKSIWKRKSKEE